MTVNATVVYRVRPSGNDVNGGGYDPSISGAIATTLSGSLANGATSMSLTSLTNLPTTGSYYLHLGATGAETTAGLSEVVLVTGAVSNPLTIARGQLGTTQNPGTWAAGTNVDGETSRCDTAVASGTTGANGSSSTTFTDASGAFNTAMVGNAIWSATASVGTLITGPYFITAVASATSCTIDRAMNSASALTGIAYKIGGAWAAVQANVSTTYIVPGATVYVRGSGSNTPNPASPDYTHATATLAAGSFSTGYVSYIGEFGRPCAKPSTATFFTSGAQTRLKNWYMVGASAGVTQVIITGSNTFVEDVKFDQHGVDQTMVSFSTARVLNCEFFSSSAPGASANRIMTVAGNGTIFTGNNFHDTSAGIVTVNVSITFIRNIFSNIPNDIITITALASAGYNFYGNTFDAGGGSAIVFATATSGPSLAMIIDNMFTNFTTAATAAINNTIDSQAIFDAIKGFVDYNTFYNNTANYVAVTPGAHDTQLSANPYVSQSTQNYALTNSALLGVGYPSSYPQLGSGKATTLSYETPGAAQPALQAAVVNMNTSIVGPGGGSVGF